MTLVRSTLFSIFLVASWFFPEVYAVEAGSEESLKDSGASSEQQSQQHPCADDPQYRAWYDLAHTVISKTACYPSLWLDGFFGDQGGDAYDGGTTIRITQTEGYSEIQHYYNETDFQIRASLPNATYKLHLLIETESPAEDMLATTPEVPGPPVIAAEPLKKKNAFQAGVGALQDLTDRVRVSVDVGLRSDIKLFVKAQFRYRFEVTPVSDWYFKQQVFWRDLEGFGEKTLLEYNRVLADPWIFRWESRLRYRQKDADEVGIEWWESQSLSYAFNSRAAIIYTLGVYGVTEPESVVSSYVSSARYRQQIFRPWLFYEIEPFVNWPQSEGYRTTLGINFRLQVFFGN